MSRTIDFQNHSGIQDFFPMKRKWNSIYSGFSKKIKGFWHIPTRYIELVIDRFLDYVPLALNRQVPIRPPKIDKPDVVVAILWLEPPRPATRFTGIEDGDPFCLLKSREFVLDSCWYLFSHFSASNKGLDGPIETRYDTLLIEELRGSAPIGIMEWWNIGILGFYSNILKNVMIHETTLLSKIIRNQIIEDENIWLPPRHAREGGHPVVLLLSSMPGFPLAREWQIQVPWSYDSPMHCQYWFCRWLKIVFGQEWYHILLWILWISGPK